MSDFQQHGLICTLQRLTESHAENLEGELISLASENPVSLVLPCHFSELGQPALAHILDELEPAAFVREIIISMNGMDESRFLAARRYFSRIRQPWRILWNDGPALSAVYQRFSESGLGGYVPGKGFNAWAAFGLVFLENKSAVAATQDCDVVSFRREMLARLCYACLHPEFSYDYSKMYYSRVTDRIYGRVSRLFLAPLLHALVRVAGHRPLLDFLLSFRYPLSGEYALHRGLAGAISARGDWGLEIGLLCEIFRATEPNKVCQVDGGGNYDHKHQPLGTDTAGGLYKMSREIAQALLGQLSNEGLSVNGAFIPALQSSYRRESREALRRFQNLARMNGLVFDLNAEQVAVDSFAMALDEALDAGANAGGATLLPGWKQVVAKAPDFSGEFLETVARENI